MVGAIFCIASMEAVSKYLMKEIGPVQTIWVRFMAQTFLVTLLIIPRLQQYSATKYPKLQLLRSVAVMLTTTLYFFSFFMLGLAEASALFNISPVLITLGAFLFLGEKINAKRIFGIGISLVGALIIIRPGGGVFTISAILPLAAAILYSVYNLATRFVGADESPWTSLFYSALLGAACYSIYIIFHWNPMSGNALFLALIIGLLATVGHLLLIKSLSLGEASLLAPFTYTSLLFSTIWGLVLFNKFPDFWTIVGALIIVFAGIYVWALGQVK
jgi:drug/metabolite transporter (DMT)-like permease